MSDTLEYFMWGYQPHFQISAKVFAESLFNRIDPRLRPVVFLVGFIRSPEAGWHDICIEPEDCGFQVDQFDEVGTAAPELASVDPRSRLIHTHPSAQRSSDAFVSGRSLSEAVRGSVDTASIDKLTFCSLPATVDLYDVVIVLQVDKAIAERYYSLAKGTTDWDNRRVARSYIEATAFEFLDACASELDRKEPGRDLILFHRHRNTSPRFAADILVRRVAHASEKFGEASDLYDTLNAISALFYERGAAQGSLLLAVRNHPSIHVEVALKEPVSLRNHRAIRRLVQVASQGTGILSDGVQVYGFGKATGNYEPKQENLFEVVFTGHGQWRIDHDGNTMLRIVHGEPQPLSSLLDEEKLTDDLKRVHGVTDATAGRLLEAVKTATTLGHGCQLVISAVAELEATRLAPQATVIEPTEMTEELTEKLCSVDGAILLDTNNYCHAFGLILDGVVSPKGDKNRGSRYNSAVRYADGRNDCLIVVISDDGMIDVIPHLRPRLDKLNIEQMVADLEALVSQEERDERRFNQLLGILGEIRFYLTLGQCERTNSARRAFEEDRISEVGRIYPVYGDLAPHPDMNDSYYLD